MRDSTSTSPVIAVTSTIVHIIARGLDLACAWRRNAVRAIYAAFIRGETPNVSVLDTPAWRVEDLGFSMAALGAARDAYAEYLANSAVALDGIKAEIVRIHGSREFSDEHAKYMTAYSNGHILAEGPVTKDLELARHNQRMCLVHISALSETIASLSAAMDRRVVVVPKSVSTQAEKLPTLKVRKPKVPSRTPRAETSLGSFEDLKAYVSDEAVAAKSRV